MHLSTRCTGISAMCVNALVANIRGLVVAFEPHFSQLDSLVKRPIYQHTVQWTMQDLTEPFVISLAVVILQRWNSGGHWGVYSFTGYFSKTQWRLWKKKALHLALEYIISCPSGVLFNALGCSAGQILFKSLQSLTVHERHFQQGNLFLLAMCMH